MRVWENTDMRLKLLAVLLVASIHQMVLADPPGRGPIDPDNPPHGRFVDDWMEIFMAGGKIGYGHSAMTRRGDQIVSELTMVMRLGRADQPIKITVTQQTTERLGGEPIRFSTVTDMAAHKTSTAGTIKDGVVTIVASQFGMTRTSEYPYPQGALMSWGLYRESLRRGFEPGTQYTLDVYVPELRADGAVQAVTRVGEMGSFTYRGKTVTAIEVSVTMTTPMGELDTISMVDRHGRVLRASIPLPGMGNIEMFTTDEAIALADFIPPEFFLATTIKAGRSIDRRRVQRIKYRLKASRGTDKLGELPQTQMQTARVLPDGTIELTVQRLTHEATPGKSAPTPSKQLAEYLGGNLMMNTDDPELITLAKRAAAGETEPFALGDRLRRFVTDFITDKNLTIGFATASEVCRNREGDCSEHGVLLAALGRLNGLPSRVAVGIAYVPRMGGQRDIFGYHMWTQFYIGGKWYDFDAAMGETRCSPARIAFAVSSLKDAGLADLSLPLLNVLGAIDLEITEVDGGK